MKISKNLKWLIGIIVAVIGMIVIPLYILWHKETNTGEKDNTTTIIINETKKELDKKSPINNIDNVRELTITGYVFDIDNIPICCAKILFNDDVYESDKSGNFIIKFSTKKKMNFRKKIKVLKKGYIEYENLVYFNNDQSFNINLIEQK